MHFQFIPRFLFGFSAVLANMSIAFIYFLALLIPVLPVIWFISPTPTRMIFGVVSNIVIPTFGRTKLSTFFSAFTVVVRDSKFFTAILTEFDLFGLSFRKTRFTSSGFAIRRGYRQPFGSICPLRRIGTFAFLRTSFSLMISHPECICLATNNTNALDLMATTSFFSHTKPRTKSSLVDRVIFSRERFTAILTNTFDDFSHVITLINPALNKSVVLSRHYGSRAGLLNNIMDFTVMPRQG